MIFNFDQYTLDTDRLELRCGEEPVELEPQVFSVLSHLVLNREHVVSKDDLMEAVWNGRIVSASALNSRINSVRRAVGDSGKTQTVIRTFPRRGFRFVAEVVEDVKGLSDPAPAIPSPTPDWNSSEDSAQSGKPSIIVLPFQNMSSDPEQDYFSNGITEDIITALSKHRWLSVTVRHTSFVYKGTLLDVRRLVDELGVSYVLEGSVRRSGNRMRISAQLIDTETGNHLWAERYDRELEDIFDVQDEINETIAARVEPQVGMAERERVARAPRRDLRAWDCFHLGVWHFLKLTPEDNREAQRLLQLSRELDRERVARAPRRDLRAWDCFHLGVWHFLKLTPEDNREAQRLLQLSRELDPDFGEAHAWWTYAICLGMVHWDTEPTPELLDEALIAANRAIELDSQNAIFYVMKSRVQLARREYASALAECEMASTMNPTLAQAYCGYGDSLSLQGRYDEAMEKFEKAVALSPQHPQRWAFMTYGALALLFKQDFETALSWTERASEIPNRQFWTVAHKVVALAYCVRSGRGISAGVSIRPGGF